MPHFLSKPWELSGSVNQGIVDKASSSDGIPFQDRTSVIYSTNVEVYCSVSGEKLNRRHFEWTGRDFFVFELPGPAMEGGDASTHEKIHAQDRQGHIVDTFTLTYMSESSSTTEACFDAFLNTAYFFRRNILKADRAIPPTVYWPEVLDRICSYEDKDPARQASIVDLAHELPLHLEKVTRQPRRTLKRIRDLERIQRVREMDKACLINLARRPGIAIAEKAGPSQRILAVRREETNNTLENRVVRHCCSLIRRAADRYLSFHHDVAEDCSPRKLAVHKFHRKAIKWGASETLNGVGSLTTPCKSPNYVLLQNPHYMRIWKAYIALVKNEEIRANVWRWKRQLWKEIATIGFSEKVVHWVDELDLSVKISVAEGRVVGGSRNFSQGCFINRDILPGPYILGRSPAEAGTLYLVDQDGLSRLNPNSNIQLMNADFYLLWEGRTQRKILPVYCRSLTEDSNDRSDGLEAVKHLAPAYSELCGVIILRPALDGNNVRLLSEPEQKHRVWDIELSVNPSEWMLKDGAGSVSPIEWLLR